MKLHIKKSNVTGYRNDRPFRQQKCPSVTEMPVRSPQQFALPSPAVYRKPPERPAESLRRQTRPAAAPEKR